MFQEREVQTFSYKVRELHDLLKQKDAEVNVTEVHHACMLAIISSFQNYQQISADIVNMAEKMNLDLHVKEDIIKVSYTAV